MLGCRPLQNLNLICTHFVDMKLNVLRDLPFSGNRQKTSTLEFWKILKTEVIF